MEFKQQVNQIIEEYILDKERKFWKEDFDVFQEFKNEESFLEEEFREDALNLKEKYSTKMLKNFAKEIKQLEVSNKANENEQLEVSNKAKEIEHQRNRGLIKKDLKAHVKTMYSNSLEEAMIAVKKYANIDDVTLLEQVYDEIKNGRNTKIKTATNTIGYSGITRSLELVKNFKKENYTSLLLRYERKVKKLKVEMLLLEIRKFCSKTKTYFILKDLKRIFKDLNDQDKFLRVKEVEALKREEFVNIYGQGFVTKLGLYKKETVQYDTDKEGFMHFVQENYPDTVNEFKKLLKQKPKISMLKLPEKVIDLSLLDKGEDKAKNTRRPLLNNPLLGNSRINSTEHIFKELEFKIKSRIERNNLFVKSLLDIKSKLNHVNFQDLDIEKLRLLLPEKLRFVLFSEAGRYTKEEILGRISLIFEQFSQNLEKEQKKFKLELNELSKGPLKDNLDLKRRASELKFQLNIEWQVITELNEKNTPVSQNDLRAYLLGLESVLKEKESWLTQAQAYLLETNRRSVKPKRIRQRNTKALEIYIKKSIRETKIKLVRQIGLCLDTDVSESKRKVVEKLRDLENLRKTKNSIVEKYFSLLNNNNPEFSKQDSKSRGITDKSSLSRSELNDTKCSIELIDLFISLYLFKFEHIEYKESLSKNFQENAFDMEKGKLEMIEKCIEEKNQEITTKINLLVKKTNVELRNKNIKGLNSIKVPLELFEKKALFKLLNEIDQDSAKVFGGEIDQLKKLTSTAPKESKKYDFKKFSKSTLKNTKQLKSDLSTVSHKSNDVRFKFFKGI